MRSLLSDVLAQTQAHSHIPLAWHRLYELWEATPDASARQAVLSRLESLALADPHSDLLRLTFLRDACKSNRLDARIAERTLDMQIPGCDRMASFIAHVWGLAVKMQTDHQAFVHHLNEAKVPTLVTRLTAVAVDQLPQQCLPKSKPASQRIAIVTPYVGNRLHTPSSQVAAQCQVLSQAGKDVAIFSCQELLVPDQRFFNGGTEEVLFPKFDIDYWQSVLPQRVQLTYSDVRFSLETRWKIMLEALFNFDPDVVLFCGFYSPLAGALYQMRPVVCLNVHALPPLAPADVWLSANEHQTMSAETLWGGDFVHGMTHFHPYRIHRLSQQASSTRQSLGLSDHSLIWVTVGARLEFEVAGAWAAKMAELMQQQPQIVWLLVGGAGVIPSALSCIPADRLKTLPTQEDVGGLLRLSDIYVNTPRIGGGFSVAEAMAEALPVVTLTNCDGADKVGPVAKADMDAYMAYLVELSHSPVLRKELGASLQRRFAERLDLAASADSLCKALDLAAQQAHRRLSLVAA